MPNYQTPGVYTEWIDTTGSPISAIQTDVVGFVGIAERGPLDTPVPIQSWRQFRAHFGGHIGAGFLAYAVAAFFENRGRRCWVVRIASREPGNGTGTGAATAATLFADTAGVPAWRVAASSPGEWGNGLRVTIQETHRIQTRTDPRRGTPRDSAVESLAGLIRGTVVRLSQPGRASLLRVVSDSDPLDNLVFWVNPRPEARLPYDAPLTGLDPALPIEIESVEYTLVVRAANGATTVVEGLALTPEHPRYGPRLLAPPAVTREPGRPAAIPAAPPVVVIDELRPGFRATDRARGVAGPLPLASLAMPVPPAVAERPLLGGADGLAALTVGDFIGEPFAATDSDEVRDRKRRGLRALEEVDEVAILAVPDITIQPALPPLTATIPPCVPDPCLPNQPPPSALPPPRTAGELPPVFDDAAVFRVQAAMIDQCERLRTRVALLDPPAPAALDPLQAVAAIRAWRRRFDSSYAALTFPWLLVLDPLRLGGALTRAIPPCGHAGGQYARSDLEVGVHRAPANAPLEMAQDVTVTVGETTHGMLNEQGINVIRALPGRGLRILGARTVSSDPTWRYINVRRLLLMIEQAIDRSIQWAVFEPNDSTTRAKLTLALTSYLLALWQQGALTGATMREAFFVKCDDENNPVAERSLGRLLAEVGVAPSQPFEFIVVRVGRTRDEFEIVEERAGFVMEVA